MDLGRPSTDGYERCIQYRGGAKADHLLSIFSPTPKIWREKTSIFEDRRQLEGHVFETAQRIDKQISYVSSRINALQNGTKPGAIAPRDFSAI